MPDPTKRLVKGLSSLLSASRASRLADLLPDSLMGDPSATAATPVPARHRTIRVALDCVAPNPNQPRRSMSDQGIASLAGSMPRIDSGSNGGSALVGRVSTGLGTFHF